MPHSDQPCLFFLAYVLTVLGGLLTLGATAWVLIGVRREQRRYIHRRDAGIRVIEEDAAEQKRLGLDVEAMNAQQGRFADEFRHVTGRELTSFREPSDCHRT